MSTIYQQCVIWIKGVQKDQNEMEFEVGNFWVYFEYYEFLILMRLEPLLVTQSLKLHKCII